MYVFSRDEFLTFVRIQEAVNSIELLERLYGHSSDEFMSMEDGPEYRAIDNIHKIEWEFCLELLKETLDRIDYDKACHSN